MAVAEEAHPRRGKVEPQQLGVARDELRGLHVELHIAHAAVHERDLSLDEQAVRQFGEFPVIYSSDSEDLVLTDLAVQKPDGTLVPTPPSSVQDLAAMPAGQLPIFVDVRQKIVSVTALRPGDVLRITGVWTVKKPIAPGQFWFQYSFDVSDAVKDEELEVDLPADRAVALKVRAPGPKRLPRAGRC